jgi:vacuolar-type H+-ATPase subunit H
VTNKKNERSSLVKGVLENIHPKSFEFLEEAINDTMKGEPGIYALYDKKKLYYVGLSINLKERVEEHTKDRHANKWNNFSIYIFKKKKFIKDVETILLRVIDPPGNTVKGKIKKHTRLEKVLKKAAKQKILEAKKEAKKNVKKAKKEAKKNVKKAKKEAKKNVKKVKKKIKLISVVKSTKKKDSRKKIAKTRHKK